MTMEEEETYKPIVYGLHGEVPGEPHHIRSPEKALERGLLPRRNGLTPAFGALKDIYMELLV